MTVKRKPPAGTRKAESPSSGRARRTPQADSFAGAVDAEELFGETVFSGDAVGDASLSAGDLDARWDQAEGAGEETVGGSAPTPDQDIVDEIGIAAGVTYQEGEPLRVGEKEEERDRHRWELDPASAEDFGKHAADEKPDAEPIRRMRHRDRYERSD
jgi:hypothetical protein